MIFIVGSGRSGTTLFQAVLNAHSKISIPPESDFALYGYDLVGDRAVTEDDYEPLARCFKATTQLNGWGWSVDEVTQIFKNARPKKFPEVVTSLSAEYARRQSVGKTVLIIKRPMLIFFAKALRKIFPDCKIIHFVRDGRDVQLSYQQVNTKTATPFGPTGVFTGSLYWKTGLDELRSAFPPEEQKGDQNPFFLELRYEDFLDDPVTESRKVCSFLGVEYEPDMINYQNKASSKEVSDPKYQKGVHENLMKGLISGNHSKYVAKMTKSQKWFFKALAGDGLARYGYEANGRTWRIGAPVRYLAQFTAKILNRIRLKKRRGKYQKRFS